MEHAAERVASRGVGTEQVFAARAGEEIVEVLFVRRVRRDQIRADDGSSDEHEHRQSHYRKPMPRAAWVVTGIRALRTP